MKLARVSAVLGTAVVAGLMMAASPAVATPAAGAFTGTASLPDFGTGVDNTGSFSGSITGYHDAPAVQAPLSATFTYNEPSLGCPALGTANGSFSGAITGNFAWTRVGATAVITVSGAHTGAAVAAFAVTSPLGNPCGQTNISAEVVGVAAAI